METRTSPTLRFGAKVSTVPIIRAVPVPRLTPVIFLDLWGQITVSSVLDPGTTNKPLSPQLLGPDFGQDPDPGYPGLWLKGSNVLFTGITEETFTATSAWSSERGAFIYAWNQTCCLLYTSPSPRDRG